MWLEAAPQAVLIVRGRDRSQGGDSSWREEQEVVSVTSRGPRHGSEDELWPHSMSHAFPTVKISQTERCCEVRKHQPQIQSAIPVNESCCSAATFVPPPGELDSTVPRPLHPAQGTAVMLQVTQG